MRGTRSLGLALVAAALASAHQQNGAAPAASATPAPSTANTSGPSGSLQKYNDEWPTSKLIGATVYNSNGNSIGTIDDLLTDDSGKITQAVISTGGGVLGMGGKLVAVRFDRLKFQPSAGNNGAPQTAGTPNTPAGSNPPAGGSGYGTCR
jgi:sporulation protein YlmC with PRC-barrel domain